jgi:hypothetical protein
MTQVKTSTLEGEQLDWAVGVCETNDKHRVELHYRGYLPCVPFMKDISTSSAGDGFYPEYCTDWRHAGPIIEREGICVLSCWSGSKRIVNHYDSWLAYIPFVAGTLSITETTAYGPTPLITAMRCYVASKLGDWVDVPDELKGEL